MDKRRRPDGPRAAAWLVPVTIRIAGADDRRVIERLADRDSRPAPASPWLVAEREGAIEAALSLRTGAVVADPFRRTAELVELLRCHAAGARIAEGPPARAGSSRPHRPRHLRLAGAAGCS